MGAYMETIEIKNSSKSWNPGHKDVEPFMAPVAEALSKHLPRGDARTEIYNRAYEAVCYALGKDRNKCSLQK